MELLPNTTDVLIIGAGPSGLALAVALRAQGITALIVDRLAEGANTSRAAVVHAHTLEVLEPLGVTPDLLAEGLRIKTFRIRDRDHPLLSISFGKLKTNFPFALLCPQNRTEAILLDHLHTAGGDVLRPLKMTRIEPGDDAVVAWFSNGTGEQSVTTRWLVGCDGMHSNVRDQAGIGFPGAAYPANFALADLRMQWPIGREEVSLFLSPAGMLVVAPLPADHFRIVATMDNAPEHPDVADMQALLDDRGPAGERAVVQDIAWSSRFHVQHRITGSPRKGRVLLCGDAAHVHSPAGGQGMNTGIQDAIALAEPLAQALRTGNEFPLDAWAASRHKVAERVVRQTDAMTRIGAFAKAPWRQLRNGALRIAGTIPAVRTAIAKQTAELTNT